MQLLDRITVEPGKRLRVTDVLDLLSNGATHAEILRDYPFLEEDDIRACIAYASRLTDHVVLQTP